MTSNRHTDEQIDYPSYIYQKNEGKHAKKKQPHKTYNSRRKHSGTRALGDHPTRLGGYDLVIASHTNLHITHQICDLLLSHGSESDMACKKKNNFPKITVALDFLKEFLSCKDGR